MIAFFIVDKTADKPVEKVWTYLTKEAAAADLVKDGFDPGDVEELVKEGVLYIDKRTVYHLIETLEG